MTRKVSLAHLSAIDLPPPALIEAAARAGFDAVGLRLIRVTDTTPGYALMSDRHMMRQTKAALRDTGLVVNDIEFVKIQPQTDLLSLVPFLDAGADLGATEVICAPYDPDLHRLSDRLGQFSDLARTRGLGVSLEFFPWTVVPDLSSAHKVVQAAGPDVAILVDALHFDRSGSTLDQLRDIPAGRMRIMHLCDAMVQDSYSEADLLHTARSERLPPGHGQIDLAGLLAEIPAEVTIGIEVPMAKACAEFGIETVLSILEASVRNVVGR